jgi:hypothetical protein
MITVIIVIERLVQRAAEDVVDVVEAVEVRRKDELHNVV